MDQIRVNKISCKVKKMLKVIRPVTLNVNFMYVLNITCSKM